MNIQEDHENEMNQLKNNYERSLQTLEQEISQLQNGITSKNEEI